MADSLAWALKIPQACPACTVGELRQHESETDDIHETWTYDCGLQLCRDEADRLFAAEDCGEATELAVMRLNSASPSTAHEISVGCGDPSCKDPNCDYGKGSNRLATLEKALKAVADAKMPGEARRIAREAIHAVVAGAR